MSAKWPRALQSCLVIAALAVPSLVHAESSWQGGVSGELWYAYWHTFASRDEANEVLVESDLEPAFLWSNTVILGRNSRWRFFLNRLTSSIEARILSESSLDERERRVYDRFIQWRGDMILRTRESKYLFSRILTGTYEGSASLLQAGGVPLDVSREVRTGFVVGDLFYMAYYDRSLAGIGLRVMEYSYPSVVYISSGEESVPIAYEATDFHAFAFAVSILDGRRISDSGRSARVPLFSFDLDFLDSNSHVQTYLDDFTAFLGYTRTNNQTMGTGHGLAVGVEGSSGIRFTHEFSHARLEGVLGIRFLYSLMQGWRNTSMEDTQLTTASENVWFGPFLSISFLVH